MRQAVNDNEAKWQKFHRENPDVYMLIKRFTNQAIKSGRKNYGMMSILQRVRWHTMIETEGDSFRINNNWSPYYARLFMSDHPQHDGFFRLRSVAGE